MSDTHGLLDVLSFCEQLALVGAQVAQDGKVTVQDIMLLARLWPAANAVLKDIPQLKSEVQTIDTAGIEAVLAKLVEVVQAAVAAFQTKKAA